VGSFFRDGNLWLDDLSLGESGHEIDLLDEPSVDELPFLPWVVELDLQTRQLVTYSPTVVQVLWAWQLTSNLLSRLGTTL
jgi:hypothetical protein